MITEKYFKYLDELKLHETNYFRFKTVILLADKFDIDTDLASKVLREWTKNNKGNWREGFFRFNKLNKT